MTRHIRWNDPEFVHVRPDGMEQCEDDCFTLADEWGTHSIIRTVTMPFDSWVWLAECILNTRDRRLAEEAKRPKRFVVWRAKNGEWNAADGTHSLAVPIEVNLDGSIKALVVMARDERDAVIRAREAEMTFGVFAREYLADD